MTEDLELFPVSDTKMDSPRLAWLKRHDVSVDKEWDDYFDEFVFVAKIMKLYTGGIYRYSYMVGKGDTEDDALCDLAKKHGLRLWNEEDIGLLTGKRRK
jgi:hypothetical protein